MYSLMIYTPLNYHQPYENYKVKASSCLSAKISVYEQLAQIYVK